jgi:hypothetical protein
MKFAYQVETDAFKNMGRQPDNTRQWEGQIYGEYRFEDGIEILTPKAFTRVNMVEF